MKRRQLLEPNSVADGCHDDPGMSHFPKIRKPQPQAPPRPCWGFFVHFSRCLLAIGFKMKTSTNLPKYTAEQISEIIARISTLRMGWLRQVEAQLASQQSRPVLDDYQLSGEPAE
jgi:hypothetical protein